MHVHLHELWSRFGATLTIGWTPLHRPCMAVRRGVNTQVTVAMDMLCMPSGLANPLYPGFPMLVTISTAAELPHRQQGRSGGRGVGLEQSYIVTSKSNIFLSRK